MTISVSLHSAARSRLNSYVSEKGFRSVTLYAEEFQDSEDSLDVWFPDALAVEIHEAIERHRQSQIERLESQEDAA